MKKHAPLLALLLTLAGIVRIVATYHRTAQAFDEPCHVAAAIEFLDKGTYQLDPVHPPLSRIAIGIPLYLAGERYPHLPESDPSSRNYNVVGNAILYGDGHYLRNLDLARMGVLPFFLLGAAVVFFWAKSESGESAALIAVFLFTTLPTVLAFSSIAYTDIAAASTQSLACFAFARWLHRFNRKSAAFLGIGLGLALATKFTSILFLSAAYPCMLLAWRFSVSRQDMESPKLAACIRQLAAALVISLLILWGGYRFSIGHVREAMNLSPDSMPSFQHFPSTVRGLAQEMVLRDARIPAPELIHGLAELWVVTKSASTSYTFGHIDTRGRWYFFPLVVGLKLPIPTMVLAALGLVVLAGCFREGRWGPILPAAAVLGVLLITLPVGYKVGVRHVLVVFPLLAILAGTGGTYLLSHHRRTVAVAILTAMIAWQAAASMAAQSDPLAYFNPFAGRDPSRIVVMGCDLDCGQDLFLLANTLRERHIDHVQLALWSSAELGEAGLPSYEVLRPFVHRTGWIAVSLRALRLGDVQHQSNPPNAFEWLSAYQPVAYVGKTILLYYIPPG